MARLAAHRSASARRAHDRGWPIALLAILGNARNAAAAATLGLAGLANAGNILYVNQNGGMGGDDQPAYTSLQDALQFAKDNGGVEKIKVAEGTYTPAGPGGPRTATFALVDGVKLYGGFPADSWNPDDRCWVTHPTILSGDLNGDDHQGMYDDNAFSVVTTGNIYANPMIMPVGPDTVLDGFTITSGYADGAGTNDYQRRGAGILHYWAQPVIRNVVIQNSFAASTGGGMFVAGGSPTLNSVTFADNESALVAGGLYVNAFLNNSDVAIINSTFTNNTAINGGGIYMTGCGTHATIEDTLFEGNIAQLGGGGALYVAYCPTFTVTHSTFRYNQAVVGGAIRALDYHGSHIADCVFESNHATVGGAISSTISQNNMSTDNVYNTVFISNTAETLGGAIYGRCRKGVFVNCLFTANTAPDAAALYFTNDFPNVNETHNVHVINTTIADNSGGKPLFTDNAQPRFHNSIIWNNGESVAVTVSGSPRMNHSTFTPGGFNWVDQGGNIDIPPLFNDAANGDYRLQLGCASVDSGSNDLVPEGVLFDIIGDDRIQDNTGQGVAVVNRGAYETAVVPEPPACPGDLTGSGTVGVADLLVLLAAWGPCEDPAACPADLTGSGTVGVADLLLLLAAWGPCPS